MLFIPNFIWTKNQPMDYEKYAAKIKRFGYWRDSAIKLEGEAVWPMTVMFLGMYSYVSGAKEELDYDKLYFNSEGMPPPKSY